MFIGMLIGVLLGSTISIIALSLIMINRGDNDES